MPRIKEIMGERAVGVTKGGTLRGRGKVLYVDCINANILVVTLYYRFTRCYLWEKLAKSS